jgi:WD40 repeat protein
VLETGIVPQCLAMADVLLSGWSDGRVLAHSSETGANLWFIDNAHPGGVTALVLSHNKRFILTGGPQGEVRLWELRSRDLVSHLKEHVAKVTCLALFDDDTMGVTASRDRSILRWDLTSEVRYTAGFINRPYATF